MPLSRKPSRLTAFLLPAVMLVAAACGGGNTGSGTTGPGDSSAGTIQIGGIFPLSGAQKDRGYASEYALRAGINYVNQNGGVKIDGKTYKFAVTTQDNRSDTTQSTTIATGMAQDQGIKFIFGPVNPVEMKAIGAVASQNKALEMVSTSSLASIVKPGDGVFESVYGLNVGVGDLFPAFFNLLKTLQPDARSISYLFDDVVGKGLDPVLVQVAPTRGLTVKTNILYPASTTDFNAPLTTIKGAGPDLLWFGSNPQLDATLVKQAGQLQVAKLYATFDAPDIVPATGVGAPVVSLGAGGIYSAHASDARSKFADLMKKYNPAAPPVESYTFYCGGMFAGVLMLQQAIQAAGGYSSIDAVKAQLNKADITLPQAGDHFVMKSDTHQVQALINLSEFVVGADGKVSLYELNPDGTQVISKKQIG